MSNRVLLAATLLIVGCSSAGDREPAADRAVKAAVASEPAEPVEVDLRPDRPVEIGDRRFVLRDVHDSRCPIGVVCVWAGEVIVTIELLAGESKPGASIELRLPEQRGPSTASVDNLVLRLLAVAPHPRTEKLADRDRYRARVGIETTG